MEEAKTVSRNFPEGRGDDDVSVIAVIGRKRNRSRRDRATESREERSKMALRKQGDLETLSNENCKGIEVLGKPPQDTVLLKERKYKEDSDYVRDSTETSSGGSTSGSGATKVRRVHRAARKNRVTTEIRRNPIRVTKKNPDKDFPRPRQQLLSAKRKEMLFDPEPSKRGKSSTMPYMNTRSVTRKMYNVGATYQAPTVRDATEWKEWPVHGMHERPVFHPQVGLAAEYLGRYFTSLDGLSYREIIDRPEIEVVSVDPRSDFLLSSSEKKLSKRGRATRGSSNSKNVKTSKQSSAHLQKNKSFESCMHQSFHCVLGYCSQVMTPTYKTNVEGKLSKLKEIKNSSVVGKEKMGKQTNVTDQSSKNESAASKENVKKIVEEKKVLDNYTIAMMPQTVKNFNQTPKTRLFQAQKVYVANSQKSIAFTNFKTLQGGQMKIQEVVRTSKNPFFLVNPAESKDTQVLKTIAVNEGTFPDVSMFKNLISNEEQSSTKRGKKVEYTVTKYLVDNPQQNLQLAKPGDKKFSYETAGKEMKTVSSLNKTWCSNDTSEIAKILSEYNKSNLKKPAIESQAFYTSMKTVRPAGSKEEAVKNIQENIADRNLNIKFPQGKWRRFHLTVEKLKDLKSNEKKPEGQNRQTFKIDQDVLPDRKTEIAKYFEPFQRQSLDKKENMCTNVDLKTQSLQELLENTAMLYCAATGTHQDDLANYIDSLDAAQSIEWLEACKSLIT